MARPGPSASPGFNQVDAGPSSDAPGFFTRHVIAGAAIAAATLGALYYFRSNYGYSGEYQEHINAVVRSLTPTKEQLFLLKEEFLREMREGLRAADHSSALKMITSYVDRVPSGTEKGVYWALDLGGTNFRVMRIRLEGGGRCVTESVSKHQIPAAVMTSTGPVLFDFIADCIASEVQKAEPGPKDFGFTFSFPVAQTSINSGLLIRWTKGFDAAGVEGVDVVRLLQEALQRKGLEGVRIAALANDTVGTWATAAYSDPDTLMGIILGTGTNAAYVENAARIGKWTGPVPASGKMVINMEWGALDSKKHAVLPYTPFDADVDKNSLNPGEQAFEKMMSGMYLGEVTRQAVRSLIERGALFRDAPGAFAARHCFKTEFMSLLAEDRSPALDEVDKMLRKELNLEASTVDDRAALQRIGSAVAARSAALTAAGIAAVLEHTGRLANGATIAVDGSVYIKYPGYHTMLERSLQLQLGAGPAAKVKLVPATDGSGLGAAIVAALAAQPAAARL